MAASIVDVVASGHINRSVILDVTERLAIQTPRYWVAQATLAVAAWLDDNPQQHREALDYALALDYEKTSLFMALLLRDQRPRRGPAGVAGRLPVPAHAGEPAPPLPGRHRRRDRERRSATARHPRLVKQVGDWYRTRRRPRRTSSTPRSASGSGGCSAWACATGSSRTSRCCAANEKAWKVLSPRHEASRAIEHRPRYFRERFETGAYVSDDVRGDLAVLLKQPGQHRGPRRGGTPRRQAREPGHHAGQG